MKVRAEKIVEKSAGKMKKSCIMYDRIVLQGENFGSRLESDANAAAYPDTMMYDDNGNMIVLNFVSGYDMIQLIS